MKRKLFVFLVMLLLLLNTTRVFAAEGSNSYTAGDYKYTIEKFAIRLYPMDLVEKTEEDEGSEGGEEHEDGSGTGTSSESGETDEENTYGKSNFSDESFTKYQKNEYAEEVEIPLSSVTVQPATFAKSADDFKIQVVELRSNITTAMIMDLLDGKTPDVSDSKIYLGELVVYYKVTQAPSKYTKYYTINTYKQMLYMVEAIAHILSPSEIEYTNPSKATNLNEENVQMTNLIGVTMDGVYYYTKAADTKPVATLYNYFSVAGADAADENDSREGLILTNISDTQFLVNSMLNLDDEEEGTGGTGGTGVTIGGITHSAGETPGVEAIPDTAMDKNQLLIIMGLFLISIGARAISKAINKES